MLNSETHEVIFNPELHLYIKNGVALSNVTSLLAKHGLATDYSSVDDTTLQYAADKGKLIHKQIEDFINTGVVGFAEEVQSFKELMEKEFITPFKTEEIVYNNWLAGTIDLMATKDGELILIDYKTSKTVNLNYVSWQLSLYNYLIGWSAISLYCVHFVDGVANLIPVEQVSPDKIAELVKCEKQGKIYSDPYRVLTKKKVNSLNKLLGTIKDLQSVVDEKTKELDEIKKGIVTVMEDKAIKSFSTDEVLITYIAGSSKSKVDTAKLKIKYPDIAKELTTYTDSKGYVRITYRGEK